MKITQKEIDILTPYLSKDALDYILRVYKNNNDNDDYETDEEEEYNSLYYDLLYYIKYLNNNKLRHAADNFESIYLDITNNTFINKLVSLITDFKLQGVSDIFAAITLYSKIKHALTNEQHVNIKKTLVAATISLTDSFSIIECLIELKKEKIISDQLCNRFIFKTNPLSIYPENLHDEENFLKHTHVLRYLNKLSLNNNLLYKDLLYIIENGTEATRSLLQRVLFKVYNNKYFKFDEALKPMDENLKEFEIQENALITVIDPNRHTIEKDKLLIWKDIFFDFNIIPAVDYFKRLNATTIFKEILKHSNQEKDDEYKLFINDIPGINEINKNTVIHYIKELKFICESNNTGIFMWPGFFDNISPIYAQLFNYSNIIKYIIIPRLYAIPYNNLINNIISIQNFLTDNDNNKKIEYIIFKKLLEEINTQSNQNLICSLFNNLHKIKFLNKRIIERIQFSACPQDAKTLEEVKKIKEKDLFTHSDIINILSKKWIFPYKMLREYLEKSTPAAKQIIQRVLFKNTSKNKIFKLDETLTPFDESLSTLNIKDNDSIILLKSHIELKDKLNIWANIFIDFKIIPLFNYFDKTAINQNKNIIKQANIAQEIIKNPEQLLINPKLINQLEISTNIKHLTQMINNYIKSGYISYHFYKLIEKNCNISYINKQKLKEVILYMISELEKKDITKYKFMTILNTLNALEATKEEKKSAFHYLINEVLKQNDIGMIKYLTEAGIISEKLANRFIFRIAPLEINNISEHTFKSTNILNTLLKTRTWADFKKIISQATPAAKQIIQKVLFINLTNSIAFKLDESLQPMNIDYNQLNISDSDYIMLLSSSNISGYMSQEEIEKWQQLFLDFKIIPAVDYQTYAQEYLE